MDETALGQAAEGGGAIQIAVATLQKSTARRLVSICAVLEGTYQMLFTSGPAVTLYPGGCGVKLHERGPLTGRRAEIGGDQQHNQATYHARISACGSPTYSRRGKAVRTRR